MAKVFNLQQESSTNMHIQNVCLVLLLAFTFTIPWENVIVLPNIGTLTRILGVLLTGFWLFSLLITKKFRDLTPFHSALYAFIIWCTLTGIWSIYFDFTLIRLLTYSQLFLIVLVFWNVLKTEVDVWYTLQAYILGTYIVVINLVYNYAVGNVTQWERRATISGSNENDIGLLMAMGLPMAWYLATSEIHLPLRNRFWRVINFAYIPAGLIGIFLTASRGSFVASLPILIYILISLKQYGFISRNVIIAVLCGLFFAVYYIVPDTSIERIFSTISQINELDLTGRTLYWQEGINVWSKTALNVVLGIGAGTFGWVVGHAAHNSLISVLVETGLVGLIIFLSILFLLTVAIFRLPSRERNLWSITLLIWFIGNTALSWEYRKATWILWSLIIITSAAEVRSSEPQPSPQNEDSFKRCAEPILFA